MVYPSHAASTHLVELETHECLDQGRLAAGLVAHDKHSRRVERLVKVLRGGFPRNEGKGPGAKEKV